MKEGHSFAIAGLSRAMSGLFSTQLSVWIIDRQPLQFNLLATPDVENIVGNAWLDLGTSG